MSARTGSPGVAIVGAGLMGRWHAHFVRRAGGTVAAIADLDVERARALARRHAGARGLASLAACLEDERVTAVHVCTPSPLHEENVAQALEAGRHVLVEKPMAGSVAATRRLLDLASRCDRLVVPVHQLPFQSGYRGLLGQRRRLGDLKRVTHTIASAGGEGRSAAERRAILVEMLPHAASLLRGLVGPVDAASFAVVRADGDGVELLGHRDGVRLHVLYHLDVRPTRNQLAVAGARGTAHVDLFHGFAILENDATTRVSKALAPFRHGARILGAASANATVRVARNAPAYPGLGELVEAFLGAAGRAGKAPVDGAEALEAAALMERVTGR